MLAFFDNAHTAQTPRGITEIVGQLMKKLDPKAELMVWPQGEFNYSIRNILPGLKSFTQHFLPSHVSNDLFSDFEGALNLVSFPRIERDNVLLHATLGHELGHPIADKFLQSESGTQKFNDGFHRAVQRLTAAVEGNAVNEAALDTLREDITYLMEFRTRGLQELISDCVGALLFGFSAVFASYDVLTINALDALPDYRQMYPPRRSRLRLQYRILEKTGHVSQIRSLSGVDRTLRSKIDKFVDHLEQLIGQDHDVNKLRTDRIIGAAYDWINETIDDAIDFAMTEVGAVAYDVARVSDEVPELIQRLDMGLPPNEIGKYPNTTLVDWRSAILSAWLCRLNESAPMNSPDDPKKHSDRLDVLNRLTLKAIEYTTLQARYPASRISP
jgi:hypothetical protein